MADISNLNRVASQVRRDILRQTHYASSGHPGGSLGCTEYFVALYYEVMDYNKGEFSMEGKNEDLFFLSNGHISPVWYSVLARSGFFPLEELSTFRRIDSRLQGHPATLEKLPGIRTASGSLGQGMSVALGAALEKRLDKDDKIVWCLTGDGELQEGQVWEAALFGAHHKVDNIIVTVDWNGQQIDGATKDVMGLGDLAAKWAAFGWEVTILERGNDMQSVVKTLQAVKEKTGKGRPQVILMKTDMGSGVDFMAGTHHWHGKAPNAEQLENALGQLEETLGDYPYNPNYHAEHA